MLTKKISTALILLSGVFYFLLALTERHDTVQLLGLFAALFIIYGWVATTNPDEKSWLYASIAFRILFLFFLPLLSNDFYRFIWDGRLLAAGYHPFSNLPSYYIQNDLNIPGITESLFSQLNSPEYFTVYPPVSQFVFWLSATISPHSIFGSVLVMKLILIAIEVGTIIFIRKLLLHYQLPTRNSLWYALNPLVIVELSGNLHVEAFMIFFLVLSVWWLSIAKEKLSAVAFSLSIATKLIPIMILPLLFFRLGWKRAALFYVSVIAVTSLLFLPLVNAEFIHGMTRGLGYYFQKFEFNASLYYLIREYGFWKYGYNIIATAGWKLALAAVIGIGLYVILEYGLKKPLSKSDSSLWTSCLFIFTIYLLGATTIHPWYITSMVLFSVFSSWRYAIVWSGLIVLTYAGYTVNGFHENYGLVAIEYTTVLLFFIFEWLYKNRSNAHIT